MILNKNHIFLTSGYDIDTFISPYLKENNITYFAYVKSYLDGSRICLSNHTDDLKAYFDNGHYLLGNTEGKPNEYESGAALWSTQPNQKLYLFSREKFNIDHGVTLIQSHEKYCEFFAFASTPTHPQVLNFYLNNLDKLQQFCSHFKEAGSALIRQAEDYKISYKHNLNITSNSQQKLLGTSSQVKIAISKRQLECATYLLKGMSLKEIASTMGLSLRTVETHLNHLKLKLSCKNRVELILKLSYLL